MLRKAQTTTLKQTFTWGPTGDKILGFKPRISNPKTASFWFTYLNRPLIYILHFEFTSRQELGAMIWCFLFQYALYIPGLTILMKIPIVLDDWLQIGYLNKIRGGWERNSKWGTGSKVDSEAGNAPVKQLDDPLGNDNKAYTVDPPAGLYPSIEVA